MGGTKNREVLRRATSAAQAEREKLLQEQAAERLAPMVEAGDWASIEDLALTGNSQERESAIKQMVQSRRWANLASYRNRAPDTADWNRTFAKNGELFEVMNNGRADIMAGPGKALGLVINGDGTTDNPGMNSGQLVQQHATFWQRLGTDSTAMSDAELQGTYERMQLMARDPRALQIAGNTVSEGGVRQFLATYNARIGGGAGSLHDLIEQQRAPVTAPSSAPTLAPIVTTSPTGTIQIGTQPMTPLFQAIHNEPATATDARATAAGGWDAYAGNPATVDEVVFIAQNKQGALRDAARQALQNRGINLPNP